MKLIWISRSDNVGHLRSSGRNSPISSLSSCSLTGSLLRCGGLRLRTIFPKTLLSNDSLKLVPRRLSLAWPPELSKQSTKLKTIISLTRAPSFATQSTARKSIINLKMSWLLLKLNRCPKLPLLELRQLSRWRQCLSRVQHHLVLLPALKMSL